MKKLAEMQFCFHGQLGPHLQYLRMHRTSSKCVCRKCHYEQERNVSKLQMHSFTLYVHVNNIKKKTREQCVGKFKFHATRFCTFTGGFGCFHYFHCTMKVR